MQVVNIGNVNRPLGNASFLKDGQKIDVQLASQLRSQEEPDLKIANVESGQQIIHIPTQTAQQPLTITGNLNFNLYKLYTFPSFLISCEIL